MQDIDIRLIHKSELEDVVSLTNQAYIFPYISGKMTTRANDTLDKISDELDKGSKIFVAEREGKIVGAVRYKTSGNAAKMFKLAVEVNSRQKGIGKKLINHIFDHAKSNKIESLTIKVAEDKGLIPFYESLGFAIDKRFLHKEHYEVSMVKSLN